MPNFAVNMLTYNGLSVGFLRDVIGAVYAYTDEIRVYDTGSTDDTVNVIKREFPKVILCQYDLRSLGEVWTNSKRDKELTNLLNKIKSETESEWILKIDDDEIFPPALLKEIKIMNTGNALIYSARFSHVGAKNYKLHIIKRFFKNIPEISWDGIYGTETLAVNGKRISSKDCPILSISGHYFYHLGGFRKDNDRKHDYTSFDE